MKNNIDKNNEDLQIIKEKETFDVNTGRDTLPNKK